MTGWIVILRIFKKVIMGKGQRIKFTAFLCCLTAFGPAAAQNQYEEVLLVKNAGDRILVPVTIGEESYDFILDLGAGGSSSLLQEYAQKLGADVTATDVGYPGRDITVKGTAILERVGVGDNIFHRQKEVLIIDDESIRSTGAAGIAGTDLFLGQVITIDDNDHTLTVSYPYKPSWVNLKNRIKMSSMGAIPATVAGQEISAVVDLWQDDLLILSNNDFLKVNSRLVKPEDSARDLSGYTAPEITIGKLVMKDLPVRLDQSVPSSLIGLPILGQGTLTFDFIKMALYIEPYATLMKPEVEQTARTSVKDGNVTHLTRADFLTKVYDYRNNDQWKYEGDKPAVIDFWAEWCGPCKRLSPIVELLADEFEGEVVFYKLNIDDEKEVAKTLSISNIPLLWLIPVEGEPIPLLGLRPAEELRRAIKENLF